MPSLRLWACLICLASVSGQGQRPVDMNLKDRKEKDDGGIMFQPGMFRGGVWKKVGRTKYILGR